MMRTFLSVRPMQAARLLVVNVLPELGTRDENRSILALSGLLLRKSILALRCRNDSAMPSWTLSLTTMSFASSSVIEGISHRNGTVIEDSMSA